MRVFVCLILSLRIVSAQDPPAPPADPAAQTATATPPQTEAASPAVTIPVITVDTAPLAPPDLDTPYAAPRDAARHRFQATLAELQTSRNAKAGVRGFAEAFALDRTYAVAAFNLGILAAITEKWDDALSALEEAGRLDGALARAAAPEIERLRLIRSLEATPEGKRRRIYNDALYPVLLDLPNMTQTEAVAALAEIGKSDPKRWEAPALLAGLSGNGRAYDGAARFLEIALSNTTEPAVKEKLQAVLAAAQRELRYAAARASADAAADRGEYDKAGDLYEKAWAVIPARADNGMEAASSWLLNDDTAHAAALLERLRESGNTEYSGSAVAMLKELEPIEPSAKAATPDKSDFFRDAGSADPVFIASLLPPIDRTQMEIMARPLPKLMVDTEPVVLLASLAAESLGATPTPALPALPPLRIAGENPWRELSQLQPAAGPVDTAAQPQEPGNILIEKASAGLRLNGTPIPGEAPLQLIVQPGLYRIGSASVEREITVKPGAHLRLQLP